MAKKTDEKIRKNFAHYVPDITDKKTKKGKYIVSTLGYQSTEEKIRAMTMAGINLALIRGDFQSNAQDIQDKIDKGEMIEPDNMSRAKLMDVQEKIEIARQTKDKLEKYKARLDAEQKKAMRERQEYLERMTKEYEGILSAKAEKTQQEQS